jgi:hypothetical protein
MDTKLATALKLKYPPVVLTWSDELPEKAIQFAKGRQGCVLILFSAAAKGKPAACDGETFGCPGGGVGLGFGNQYLNFPGGIDCFCRFLSTGNEGDPVGGAVGEAMKGRAPDSFAADFLLGERYIKTPELTRKFVDAMPMIEPPARYAVFLPLTSPLAEEPAYTAHPRIVTFVADPDQLSALVVLANFDREPGDNVIVPFGAGCQSIGILALKESGTAKPRAVMGLLDLSARVNTKTSLGRGYFTFSVPWERFLELESNVDASFLRRDTWKELMGK